MQQGTKQVSGQRLTAKKVKFEPTDWMTQGEWDWLVHFDALRSISLEQLPSFIQKRSNASLILLDWCHRSKRCCGQGGFACFQAESYRLMGKQSQRIENSTQEYLQWVSDVTEMVKKSTLSLPHYFETNIFMRNLKSKCSGEVKKAFKEVFEHNRKVPRDQPFLPVFLEKHGLNAEIITVSYGELKRDLGWKGKPATSRLLSNLMVDASQQGPLG